MTELFPTFARWLGVPSWTFSSWTSTPWWPADTLASRQTALLQVLSVAATERLELAPLVASLAQEHRGRYRRRLFRLAKRLATGTPLPDALEQTPGALSDEHVLAVRFGMQSGSLSEVLRSLVEQPDESLNSIAHRVREVGFYGIFVGIVFLLMLTFMLVKLVPSFQAILEDFSLEATEPLKLLIDISEAVVRQGPLIPLAILFAWWLIVMGLPQRFFRRRVSSRLFKPVVQLRAASLLRLLAVSQDAGRPLPAALSTLARYHYDSTIRNKLLFVRNEVEQAANLWQSLAKTRLLSAAEARALESSAAADATAWTLRHLADWKTKQVARRYDVCADFLMPVLVLLMASVVLLTALATLTPLIRMISGLS